MTIHSPKLLKEYQESRKNPFSLGLGCKEFELVAKYILCCLVRDNKTFADPVGHYRDCYNKPEHYHHSHCPSSLHDFHTAWCVMKYGWHYLSPDAINSYYNHCKSDGDKTFYEFLEDRNKKNEKGIPSSELVGMIEGLLKLPSAQVCRHLVATDLLFLLEKHGVEMPDGLGRAVVRCQDEQALQILEGMK